MIPAIPAMLSRIPLSIWTGAGAAAVVYVVLALPAQLEARSEKQRADRLHDAIYAEDTGWRDRLTTCRGSNSRLVDSLDRQSGAIAELEAESEAKQARAAEAVRLAQAARIDAERRAGAILSRPILGDTACERVEDVDASILAFLQGQER